MSSLLDRFLERAHDSRSAFVDERGSSSYADVVRNAIAVSSALDLAPHERVALLIHPSADFLSAFFGVLMAGGTVVVLSPLHPEPETRFFCADAGVRTILFSEPMRSLASPHGAHHKLQQIDDFETTISEPSRTAKIAESAPALQLYTSGTTGKPKGAVLTHANIGIQQKLVGEAWGFSESDVLLHSLPLHHMHGLAIALLTAIGAGASVRLRSGFDAKAIWEDMANATVFMGVPAMYHRLFLAFDSASEGDQARFASNAKQLRLATSGSAALPVVLAQRWQRITETIPLERFGMTEIGVGISNTLRGPRFAGHVGFPLPTVETRIVGEDETTDADVGELWIRGPSVFAGYHQREEETKRAFAPDPNGGVPWFRTGDTVTRNGELEGAPFRILGRTSVDILKSGGYKLSALEIEEVLREHDGVLEVAVVGIPNEAWGEKVVACVVRRRDDACDAEGLRAFVRERLAPYKVPKDVIFLGELPKNALGKVVKPDLIRSLSGPLETHLPSPTPSA